MFYRIFLLMMIAMIATGVASGAEFRRVMEEGSVLLKGVPGKMVEVRCEAGIASLVRSGDMTTLKVERVNDRLFITPLSQDPAELVVLDVTGRSYRLRFSIGTEGEEGVVLGTKTETSERFKEEGAWSVDFLRAMVKGLVPAGATEERAEQVVFNNERMRVMLLKRYVTPQIIGYVFNVENVSAQALVVPIEHIVFRGLLAVCAEQDVLEATGKINDRTKMFLIARK
jgi:hypothetical protein